MEIRLVAVQRLGLCSAAASRQGHVCPRSREKKLRYVFVCPSVYPIGPQPGENAADLLLYQIFDEEYEIKDRPIGVGGFSNVFLAWDKLKSRQVACKVIHGGEPKRELEDLDKHKTDNNPIAQLSRQKRRQSLIECVELDTKYFEREIEILRKLSHVSSSKTTGKTDNHIR